MHTPCYMVIIDLKHFEPKPPSSLCSVVACLSFSVYPFPVLLGLLLLLPVRERAIAGYCMPSFVFTLDRLCHLAL